MCTDTFTHNICGHKHLHQHKCENWPDENFARIFCLDYNVVQTENKGPCNNADCQDVWQRRMQELVLQQQRQQLFQQREYERQLIEQAAAIERNRLMEAAQPYIAAGMALPAELDRAMRANIKAYREQMARLNLHTTLPFTTFPHSSTTLATEEESRNGHFQPLREGRSGPIQQWPPNHTKGSRSVSSGHTGKRAVAGSMGQLGGHSRPFTRVDTLNLQSSGSSSQRQVRGTNFEVGPLRHAGFFDVLGQEQYMNTGDVLQHQLANPTDPFVHQSPAGHVTDPTACRTFLEQQSGLPFAPPDMFQNLRYSPACSIGLGREMTGASLAAGYGPSPFMQSCERPSDHQGSAEQSNIRNAALLAAAGVTRPPLMSSSGSMGSQMAFGAHGGLIRRFESQTDVPPVPAFSGRQNTNVMGADSFGSRMDLDDIVTMLSGKEGLFMNAK